MRVVDGFYKMSEWLGATPVRAGVVMSVLAVIVMFAD